MHLIQWPAERNQQLPFKKYIVPLNFVILFEGQGHQFRPLVLRYKTVMSGSKF
jgi:hypothetical protein